MLWYILVLLICIAVDVLIWYGVSRWYIKDSIIDVVLDHLKLFWKTVIIAVIIGTLLCSVKLYNMSSCSVKGFITNASTQYSWVMKQCQAKNSSGVYVDIEKTRGIPSDDAHEQ